jgi:hypothetical protein
LRQGPGLRWMLLLAAVGGGLLVLDCGELDAEQTQKLRVVVAWRISPRSAITGATCFQASTTSAAGSRESTSRDAVRSSCVSSG